MLSIEKIEIVFEEIDVFDIEVEEDHSFVCKSAILHNCHSCAGLSRKRWKTKEPHPVPPLHPSCRCVLIPVTELTDLGEDVPRPMANADFMALAKEDYEEKYPGKKWDDLSYATKKKYYYQAQKDFEKRTGKPAYSQAPGNMKFSDYFQQMSEEQKRHWLGKGRYELWKNGNLDLDKFIPPYPDRAFTVKELKEMDKKSFTHGMAFQASRTRIGDSVVLIHDKTKEYPIGGKYKKMKPYYNSAVNGEDNFKKRLLEKAPDVEFAAVYDKDGDLFCVAMGEKDHVQYRVPLSDGVVIHNHPKGTTPSWKDFEEVTAHNLKKMEIVTSDGVYRLTKEKVDDIVPLDNIKKRYNSKIGTRDSLTFEEWKEVLNDTNYRIDLVNP